MGIWTCDISRRLLDPTDAVHRGYYLCAIFWFIQIWRFYQTLCEVTYRNACLKARPANKQNKHTWAHMCTWLRVIVTSSSCSREIIMQATARMKSPAIATWNRKRTGFCHAYIFRKGYHGYALLKVWNQGTMGWACRWNGKKGSTYSLWTWKLDVKGLLGRPGRRRGYIRMDHKRIVCEEDRAQRWALLKSKTFEIYKQNPLRRVFLEADNSWDGQ